MKMQNGTCKMAGGCATERKRKKQPWVALDDQRSHVPQTRVKADVTSEDVKKVIKSGGHRACFDVKMLTNTAI